MPRGTGHVISVIFVCLFHYFWARAQYDDIELSRRPEYRQSPHLVQQSLVNPKKNPILPLFFSGSALLSHWDAASIAPIVLPLQDRNKNTCCFCSHMIAILMVSALASGKVPYEKFFNQHLKKQGFRCSYLKTEEYDGPQGRDTFKRGKNWTYPTPPNVFETGKKRQIGSGVPSAKRLKLENNSQQKWRKFIAFSFFFVFFLSCCLA